MTIERIFFFQRLTITQRLDVFRGLSKAHARTPLQIVFIIEVDVYRKFLEDKDFYICNQRSVFCEVFFFFYGEILQ